MQMVRQTPTRKLAVQTIPSLAPERGSPPPPDPIDEVIFRMYFQVVIILSFIAVWVH